MIEKPVKINSLTALSQKCKNLAQLKQVHAHVLKRHLPINPYSIAPILSLAATSKNALLFSYARSIFQHSTHRNTFMHNSMIRGYLQSYSPQHAILCYLEMLKNEIVANNYTFPSLMKACTMMVPSAEVIGRLVHGHVLKFGFRDDPYVVSALIEFYSTLHAMRRARILFDMSSEKDVVLWTAMIDGYGKTGDLKNARELFEKMPERNAVTWSAMMAAYSRINDFREVLRLFREMQKAGIEPNEAVLVSVLTACGHLGALMQGLWVHSYTERFKFDSNPILATALVDMYSRCGCVESALTVFGGISHKDTGAWNAMIFGFAMSGDAKKSFDLFHKMNVHGTQPNETTFVTLLTACTHARMVREGLELFEQMSTLYGVEPKLQHYACVIDLLSRAGMVEEGEKFMDENMESLGGGDANMWGPLLNACRIYKNVEVGHRIWQKMVNAGVADCGAHVLSYNIYKEAGWDVEANTVRRSISEAGLRKKPGCSLIEVNNVVEEFLAGDLCHSKAQEIREVLDSFLKMLNLEYV